MRATVTGSAGFIGSHLVDALRRQGHAVTGIDRATGPDIEHAGISRFPADVIYHLAGPVGPVGVIEQAGHIVEDIIRDARLVRDAALDWGATLVYVSTSEVYGPQPAGPIRESARRVTPAGHTARMEYAVAKMAAETMLLNTPGLDVRIIRPFNVGGPRQKETGGFVLPRFIRQAKAGDTLTVYQPGDQRRAFTHVLDIVAGIMLAAQHGHPGAVYNLGNAANECDILTLAREVRDLLGSTSAIEIVDPVELWGPGFHEAPDKVPDASRAMDELGWQPKYDRKRVILDAAA